MKIFSTTKIKTKKSGVTLIELLMYIAMSAIILMTSSMFLTLLINSRIKNQTIAEVGQQGTQIIQNISRAIRKAESINSPSAGSSSTTLSITMTDSGVNPTIFQYSNGAMEIREGSGGFISLSSPRIIVSDVTFRNLSRPSTPGIIRTQFTLSHLNPAGRNEYSFSRTFTTSSSLRYP